MDIKKIVAIVLSGGSGKRMLSNVPKQYMKLADKPILYYSLNAFENSCVDEVILVVGKDDIDYCRENIVEKYKLQKVHTITEGGKERYHSVYNGIKAIENADYILIHDGARPLITVDDIHRIIEQVRIYKACIAGVPTKDTVKIVNNNGMVTETPNRDFIWNVQTPQAFSYELIKKAYDLLMNELNSPLNITDDAMVVEHMLHHPIKMVYGSYRNIKITTPEDIIIGEAFINEID